MRISRCATGIGISSPSSSFFHHICRCNYAIFVPFTSLIFPRSRRNLPFNGALLSIGRTRTSRFIARL